MWKYPKIKHLGDSENRSMWQCKNADIYITEKVDGGNGSFFVDDDGLRHECSRNRDLTHMLDSKTFQVERTFLGQCLEGKELDSDFIYYGEFMARHTINYNSPPGFIGFDIKVKVNQDGEEGLFIGHNAMIKEYERLGIPTIPLIEKITVDKFSKKTIDDYINTDSKYYKGKVEGVVGKIYDFVNHNGNQIYFKAVREDFKEKNKATFGRKIISEDTQRIVMEFCTFARVRKIINKFINEEDMELNRVLMKHVPVAVVKDILTEEILYISDKYKNIDFGTLKKLVAKECLKSIDRMLTDRMIEIRLIK